ncbi:hypothetical protein BDP27DRAFT_249070 [Rhodocollybia butyracea]|uniref:Uncharacterized protein n=1 Tax=Rhodocollybia butyracea TaxID=206335 RepID=A0A9P5PJQ7_9AGAR|nr:hypothetical protein BDP27DRAFT_249070 [Rhodocollybia butyracea]
MISSFPTKDITHTLSNDRRTSSSQALWASKPLCVTINWRCRILRGMMIQVVRRLIFSGHGETVADLDFVGMVTPQLLQRLIDYRYHFAGKRLNTESQCNAIARVQFRFRYSRRREYRSHRASSHRRHYYAPLIPQSQTTSLRLGPALSQYNSTSHFCWFWFTATSKGA